LIKEIVKKAHGGSIEKSLIQIDKLLDERDEEESQDILKATKLKIESMKRA
jgi:hypothetical protein